MAAPLYGSKEYVKYFFTDDNDNEPRPTEWEIALHTGDPGKGDDNEVSDYGYSRQDVTFESYEEPNEGRFYEAKSEADVVFPAAEPGTDYIVTHYTVRDKTQNEALAVAALVVPIPVAEGTVITFPAGYIKVRGI